MDKFNLRVIVFLCVYKFEVSYQDLLSENVICRSSLRSDFNQAIVNECNPRLCCSNHHLYVLWSFGSKIGKFFFFVVFQHALKAVFPLGLKKEDLRYFHRPPLKRLNHGPLLSTKKFHPVKSVLNFMQHKEKQRALVTVLLMFSALFSWYQEHL